MTKVLIIRLSAIGDVAMTIPVIYSAAVANPEVSFTVLTQTFLIPLFINRPENVGVVGIDIKGAEKSLAGLIKFASGFSSHYHFDLVLDLHNVLRSKLIRFFFRIKGIKVFVLDKARKERERLTRKTNKVLVPLKPVIIRYADVFKNAGLAYTDNFISLFAKENVCLSFLKDLPAQKEGKWIGIAPFAKHQGKIYPIQYMEKVVKSLSARKDFTLFLFGGGGAEKEILERWADTYSNVKSLAGCYSLDNELRLMSQLDLLLSMDSSNMHFASLVRTRVLSVWGATHPFVGFYGYKQNPEDVVQLDLYCRPCSAFGQKPCYRGDWACMSLLDPETIIEKVKNILQDN